MGWFFLINNRTWNNYIQLTESVVKQRFLFNLSGYSNSYRLLYVLKTFRQQKNQLTGFEVLTIFMLLPVLFPLIFSI